MYYLPCPSLGALGLLSITTGLPIRNFRLTAIGTKLGMGSKMQHQTSGPGLHATSGFPPFLCPLGNYFHPTLNRCITPSLADQAHLDLLVSSYSSLFMLYVDGMVWRALLRLATHFAAGPPLPRLAALAGSGWLAG